MLVRLKISSSRPLYQRATARNPAAFLTWSARLELRQWREEILNSVAPLHRYNSARAYHL
jgi:hypothetical protein